MFNFLRKNKTQDIVPVTQTLDVQGEIETKEPLQATHTVSGVWPKLSKLWTEAYRIDSLQNVQATQYVPGKKIWLYNASGVEHTLTSPLFKSVVVPANTTRNRYVMVTSFPENMLIPQLLLDVNETQWIHQDGKRAVMDLINPSNLGIDQAAKNVHTYSLGEDYGKRGVFWSMHNPPLKREVNAAVARMQNYYKDIIERMNVYFTLSAQEVEELRRLGKSHQADRKAYDLQLNITPDHHAAAEYFRFTPMWHPVLGSDVKQ